MSGQRGQQMSGLPVTHVRAATGGALCGSKRRQGVLLVDSQPDCRRCRVLLGEKPSTLPPQPAREQRRMLGAAIDYAAAREAHGLDALTDADLAFAERRLEQAAIAWVNRLSVEDRRRIASTP